MLLVLGIPLGAGLGLLGACVIAAGLVLLALSARRRPGPVAAPVLEASAMGCPACGRELPAGTRFCPVDARPLVPLQTVAERRGASAHCPRCRRAFDPGTRYCPYDAEDLVPAIAALAVAHDDHDHGHLVGSDKICPVCAARYGIDASFCGRDGSELQTVN